MISVSLSNSIDWEKFEFVGSPRVERRLSDLCGCFADEAAYGEALSHGDPLIYSVSSQAPADGAGQLHYGLGMIAPGRVGREYYLTKGHLHAWREAAEVYLGLAGEGFMLLEEEATGESRLLQLGKDRVVYVPGGTAHRTVNTGADPLVYIGVYPAGAGHDYGTIAEKNFRQVVTDRGGRPVAVDRAEY